MAKEFQLIRFDIFYIKFNIFLIIKHFPCTKMGKWNIIMGRCGDKSLNNKIKINSRWNKNNIHLADHLVI